MKRLFRWNSEVIRMLIFSSRMKNKFLHVGCMSDMRVFSFQCPRYVNNQLSNRTYKRQPHSRHFHKQWRPRTEHCAMESAPSTDVLCLDEHEIWCDRRWSTQKIIGLQEHTKSDMERMIREKRGSKRWLAGRKWECQAELTVTEVGRWRQYVCVSRRSDLCRVMNRTNFENCIQ